MTQHEPNSVSSFISDSEKTIPLGMGTTQIDEVALDPLANVSERKKFKAGSLILVAVIVVACGGIWFMKSLSKVSAATGGDKQVEASIDNFIKDYQGSGAKKGLLSGSEANVLAVLSGSYTERQVPLQNVQRNPFILYGEMAVALGAPTSDGGGQTQRRAAFEKAASRLELKSVIMSSQPLANISGKIVRKGDELVTQPDGLAFRVMDIAQDGVTIAAQDLTLTPGYSIVLTIKRDK